MTHDELVLRGRNWLKNNPNSRMRFPIILTEYKSYANSEPDVLGLNHARSVVIECKVSRSDYFADQKKRCMRMSTRLGSYRYYLCPAGLLRVDDIKNGWGLLYCHPHKITIEKDATFYPPEETRPEEYQIMYSIIRRLMSLDGHDKTLDMLKGRRK